MMTFGPLPGIAKMLRAASSPFIFGMRMSISTTSGWVRRTISVMPSPSSAVPTTVIPGWASNRASNPARIMDWSSTISTRTGSAAPPVSEAMGPTYRHDRCPTYPLPAHPPRARGQGRQLFSRGGGVIVRIFQAFPDDRIDSPADHQSERARLPRSCDTGSLENLGEWLPSLGGGVLLDAVAQRLDQHAGVPRVLPQMPDHHPNVDRGRFGGSGRLHGPGDVGGERGQSVRIGRLYERVFATHVIEHRGLGQFRTLGDPRQRRTLVPLVGDQFRGDRDQLCAPSPLGERAGTACSTRYFLCHTADPTVR